MIVDIDELLDQMVKEDAWDSDIASNSEANWRITGLVDHTEMPDDLRTFLARTSGAKLSIGNIYVFDPEVLDDVHHNQPKMFINVPNAIFFAHDNGGRYFFMDTDNTLGWGAGAVFLGKKGAMYDADGYVPCGRSLAELLMAILDEDEVWEGPTLENRAIKYMFKALATNHQHCTGNSGADLNALYAIVDRHNQGRLPTVLEALLQYRNGLTFTKPNITIWDTDTIDPTPGTIKNDGSFFAVTIGEDSEGYQYILTHIGEKGDLTHWPFLAGRVMRLGPNQDLHEAEYLGYLPELVETWVGGVINKADRNVLARNRKQPKEQSVTITKWVYEIKEAIAPLQKQSRLKSDKVLQEFTPALEEAERQLLDLLVRQKRLETYPILQKDKSAPYWLLLQLQHIVQNLDTLVKNISDNKSMSITNAAFDIVEDLKDYLENLALRNMAVPEAVTAPISTYDATDFDRALCLSSDWWGSRYQADSPPWRWEVEKRLNNHILLTLCSKYIAITGCQRMVWSNQGLIWKFDSWEKFQALIAAEKYTVSTNYFEIIKIFKFFEARLILNGFDEVVEMIDPRHYPRLEKYKSQISIPSLTVNPRQLVFWAADFTQGNLERWRFGQQGRMLKIETEIIEEDMFFKTAA